MELVARSSRPSSRTRRSSRAMSGSLRRRPPAGHRSEPGGTRPGSAGAALSGALAGTTLDHVPERPEAAMSDDVRLVRPADRTEGQPTPGMHREQAVSTGG